MCHVRSPTAILCTDSNTLIQYKGWAPVDPNRMGSRISAAVVKPAMRRGAGLPRRRMQRWCDHRDMLMKNCNLSQQLKGHRRTATAPERDYPQLYNHRDCSDKFPHDFHESQSLLSGAFCSRLSFALPILTATRQLIQGFRSVRVRLLSASAWRQRGFSLYTCTDRQSHLL